MKFPPAGLRGERLREAAPELLRTINQVRAALDAKLNPEAPGAERKWFDLEAVYEDRAVLCLDGRHWSYPYTVAADGAVTVGDPVEVVEEYRPLKEALAAPSPVGLRLVEAEGQAAGVVWDAVLIRAGLSENSVFYPDAVLREAVPLFDGVRINIKSDAEHLKSRARNVAQVIGWGEAPRFVEGSGADSGHVAARLHLPGLPEPTRALLVAAAAAGRQDIAGLSIDADGKAVARTVSGKRVRVAEAISRVESVDLIVEPGAGGRLIRLTESAPNPALTGDPEMTLRALMLRLVEAKTPEAFAKIDPETIAEEALETLYREAVAADVKPNAPDLSGVEERLRMIEARAQARQAIAACTLPTAAKDRLERVFAVRERFTEADVTAAIEEERAYLSRFTESGRVVIQGLQAQVEDVSVKISGMLDAFFDPQHKDHRSVQSFKECYVEITGDRRVTGRLEDCDRSRLREAGGARLAEAVMDSASFAYVLGDAVTRAMVADYRTPNQYDVWRDLANVVPLTDFRTQHRTRMGGFGDLVTVAEGADYAEAAKPGDEEATYKAGKRGRLYPVTLEMVRNDDVGVVRKLPGIISGVAKRTLSKFVLDFLRTNPTIYDGVALFHASHNNLGSAALSAAAWSACRLAMMKQPEADNNERLGIPPALLWLPTDLEEAAVDLFGQRGTNNDQSFIQTSAPKIRGVWYWTDATDWVATADKRDIETVEIGFLDGNEEPELFVQDNPSVGSLFASDKITYKLRHAYGGAVTNFRGAYKAVVAG